MNYPIWELTTLGGGFLIALISVLHVYIAHLAVGGGAFIWLTDRKGFKENNPDIHRYVKKHTEFFLLLTMVFGGVTGVGIWFIIALVHPAATSKLIHAFVFGWAIEWVFFVGEIVSLLIYFYQFDRLSRRNRLLLAFLYFLFAWLSLFIINGILSFMLTPGKWLETQAFWHGFLNPTFFSSLFFRTFVAAMFAGLFGYLTSVFLKPGAFRDNMLKYCSQWLLFPMPGLILSGMWYYFSLPAGTRMTTFNLNPETQIFVIILLVTTFLIFIGGAYFSRKSKAGIQKVVSFVLVFIGLLWMGGFEYIREIARKPFVINNFMYSTSIKKSEIASLNQTGVLATAKWSSIKHVTPENQIEAGKELFRIQCSSCHTINGIRNDIMPRTAAFPFLGMLAQLDGQGKIQDYMPPVAGTQIEREALAAYIVHELHQQKILTEPEPFPVPLKPETEIPAFVAKSDKYVLLAWNDLGMHCISDSDPWFVILPPANTLEAQLIQRGPVPVLVTENVVLSYQVEAGFENPAKHVDFWKYSQSIFGTTVPENIGLSGNGMSGNFKLNAENSSFIADKIPVVPYPDTEQYNPYPVFEVVAKDAQSNQVLARTRVVAPVSTEMGCRNCHGGEWRWNSASGLSETTAMNVLAAHDRLSGTNLLTEAKSGNPKLCQSCHADPALGAKGKPELLNLSAAIHGWHANYLAKDGAAACALCHPANPTGNTRCSRGIHNSVGVTCVNCHGNFQEHALSLLQAESEKAGAARLMQHLQPVQVTTIAEINPRTPWLKEPDCLNCHVDFEKPVSGASGYNQWTESPEDLYRMRTDNVGVRCSACHSSPHAEYPARNAYGENRDNLQPMQYSGKPFPIGTDFSCEVCHTQKMTDPIHHENMLRPFRRISGVK